MITAKDIKNMNYVQFISFLKETNRCPGGKRTIHKILLNTFASSHSKILEIGSNTGFTSLEIARTVGAEVVGIDPASDAVQEANSLLALDEENIQKKVRFLVASAYEIPFTSNTFDILVAGGATSFMDDKVTALKEYHRVLKCWGFLTVANLYYRIPPPPNVVNEVSQIIGAKINPWGFEEWQEIFGKSNLFEQYFIEKNSLRPNSPEALEQYVAYFLQKPHIKILEEDVRVAVRERWTSILEVFNENHKYLGFFIGIFRKRSIEEEPEFFLE